MTTLKQLSRSQLRLTLRALLSITILGVLSTLMNNPVHSQENQTGLYETWELQLTNDKEYKNPFKFSEIQLEAIFTSPSANQFKALGFYDGDGNGGQTGNVWKLRFMPNETGQWTYTFTWSDGTAGGSGKFTVTKQTNPKNHGHVQVDPVHPRYLIHDDGTAHYWWGANWMTSELFGPESKWGEQNPTAEVTDTDLIDYLDSLEQYNHNGLLIKFGFYPLENNTYSWDLFWLHKKEWFIQEMAARGIYAQINIFDTWSRTPPGWSVDTDGDNQVLNAWSSGDKAAKENYIKTIVARFSGFANVYWELGNEMEHAPNSGTNFAAQANSQYIPWIRQNDPYNLPIGLSEGVWQETDVDIGFLHQSNQLPDQGWSQPTIMNELVGGGITGNLWQDEVIRNSANRIAYRRTFWRMFTYGGSGSSEATWVNPFDPNEAILTVMADQQRLRKFLEALPTHINEMEPLSGIVLSGPGEASTRGKVGTSYVTYFLLSPNRSVSAGNVEVDLPAGDYGVTWYDPKDGTSTTAETVQSPGEPVSIDHPAFTEDIVLLLRSYRSFIPMLQRGGETQAVVLNTPQNLIAKLTNPLQIDLSWTPVSICKVDICRYQIYRNGINLAETTSPTFSDSSITTNTAYTYQVSAVTSEGFESTKSTLVKIITPTADTPPFQNIIVTLMTFLLLGGVIAAIYWWSSNRPMISLKYYRGDQSIKK